MVGLQSPLSPAPRERGLGSSTDLRGGPRLEVRGRRSLRRQRGITLIETLLAVAVMAIAMGAVSRAYVTGLSFESSYSKKLDARAKRAWVEDRISRLLAGTEVNGGNSYLVSPAPQKGNSNPGGTGPLGRGSDSIVFTTWNVERPAPFDAVERPEFETLNSRFGPQGGATEIALSLIPTSSDAGQRQGLFLREERPPDGDLTQGGEESVLDDEIRDIRFEFYDGADWRDSWDTQQTQKGELPSAVRVTYLLRDEDLPHTFLVRLLLSQPKQGGNS